MCGAYHFTAMRSGQQAKKTQRGNNHLKRGVMGNY